MKILICYGGKIVYGQYGVDYEGGHHRVISLSEGFDFNDLVECCMNKLGLDSDDVISLIYRLPCMSNGEIHYYCMDVKDNNDIDAFVDSFNIIQLPSHHQLYVQVRRQRARGRKSTYACITLQSVEPFQPGVGCKNFDFASSA